VQRLTISLDDNIAAAIDAFMEKQGYSNRSEAIRDLVRDSLVRSEEAGPSTHRCVAAVCYV
jgi:CopG family nickel-responsive transcriptional regulator